MTKTKNTDNTFDPASQRNQDNSSPTPSESTPDPTITTPEEEKQFIEQGKLQTEQMDPEANQIEREFDSYPEQPSTPKKGNKGITFQSTLKAWTLVTPKDKMKQLRKVKAQAKAAQEAAQEAAATKKAQMAIQTSITNSTSVKDSDSKALVQPSSTVQDKVTFATKVLATAASTTVQQTTSDAKETSKEVSNSKEGSDTSSPPATTVTKVVKKKKPKKKPNLTRPFNTYYILKLKIQASTNSVKELTTKMQTFLQAIQELDGSLIIYRYRDNIPIHAIMSKEEIPTNINRFKEFFSGANPSPREGHVWASVWIGHSEEPENLHTNFKYWSMENDSFLYKKKLQEKQSVREYFLLYSTDKIDVEILHSTVSAEIKKVTNREYKFAFVWTVIKSKGAYVNTETTDKKGSQYIKALHVEVPRNESIATYQILLKFLGSTSKYRLLQRNLRMIPVLTNETPSHKKSKISRLIGKQQRYLNNITTAVSYDLQDVDYIIPSLQKSLRQMIMDIEQVENPGKSLFLSIDYNEFSSAYVLTFPTHLESEARDCISQLPSFLHWLYGDHVLEQLTDFAVERAYAAPWSEELMRAVSQEDTALDNLLQEADQVDWLRNESEVIIEDSPTKNAASAFLFNRTVDNDSVSTFRTKKSRPEVPDTPLKKQKANESEDVVMLDTTNPETSNIITPVTPEMQQIQKLETPLQTNDTNQPSGDITTPENPSPTDPIGPLLENRQATKESDVPSDHVSESEVSL